MMEPVAQALGSGNNGNTDSTIGKQSAVFIPESAAKASNTEKDEKQTSVMQDPGDDPFDDTVNNMPKTGPKDPNNGDQGIYQGQESLIIPKTLGNSREYPVSGQTQVFLQEQDNSLKQTSESNSIDTEVYNVNFMKSLKQTSRSPENKLQEVYKTNSNNTYRNNTEYSYTKSYHIVSGDREGLPAEDKVSDAMRYDETTDL